jgi:hypothetical protein
MRRRSTAQLKREIRAGFSLTPGPEVCLTSVLTVFQARVGIAFLFPGNP